jgi:hypothetical protein
VTPIQEHVTVDYDNTQQAVLGFRHASQHHEVLAALGVYREWGADPAVLHLAANAVPVDIERLRQGITIITPDARGFPMSCLTGEGLAEWLAWLRAALHAKRLHGALTLEDTSGACDR